MVKHRWLDIEEIDLLENCLIDLANYHNNVSAYFEGIYPLKPYEETLNAIKQQVREKKSIVDGLFVKGSVIGFCKISLEGKAGQLDYLYINEKYRGLGYGTLLMDWAMSEFERNHVDRIDLKVVVGNAAEKMYQKYGFHPQQTIMSKIIT